MALFRPLLGDLRGSIADNTFSQNAAGSYIRRRTKPVDPQTPGQVAARAALQFASTLWLATTQLNRDEWAGYAAASPWKNALGDTIFLSGRNQFIRVNSFLQQFSVGTQSQETAPQANGYPINAVLSLSMDTVTGLTVDVMNINAAGDQFLFNGSGNLAQTVNFFKGPWPVAVREEGAVALPLEIVPGAAIQDFSKRYVGVRRYEAATGRLAETQFTFQTLHDTTP